MKKFQKGNGEIGFILVVIILVFLVWLALGGKDRSTPQDQGPYIVPLTEENGGQSYGN